MRILVVSAHYPPNFISGGTLGPQRLARGLQNLGHDVSVYAGWLGDREPLATWSDKDETGMPVRWIVITPWTHWWESRNFDNPDVTTDFRVHLMQTKPDVVHVHALQTLGAGVIEACADAGVPVVVTMHDFWWICGRQFLSNRALRLCSAVVSCGMCHCEVNRAWLDQRNARLARALERVDAIFAVSESEGAILRANGFGISPDRPPLIVDENGLPSLPAPGRERLVDEEVVFLYTGGSEVMKGARVVLEAAARISDRGGWRLHAYGLREYAEAFHLYVPARVELYPRFAPEEVETVFDKADVLLLTSVIRESHSLVTREALARGVPVITSDTLGPEEVVVDHDNGLVVPAGDPAALAAAMLSIVDDRQLRHRLAVGARNPVPIRDLDDQIRDLDARLRSIVDRSLVSAPSVPARSVRRVLFVVGIEGAPLRYRAQFAAEALELHGVTGDVRHYRSPEAAALAALADAVVVYRVPATVQLLGLIDATRSRGVPVFFDIDDLIFEPELAATIPSVQALPDDQRALYLQGVRRYRTTLEACDAFIGSTEALVAHVRENVGIEAHRWWNGVGIGPARCSDAALAHPRTAGPRRIGYMSGTSTHDEDWRYIEPAVIEVLDARPDTELWLGGLVTPTAALDRFGDRVRRIPLQPWQELPWVLRDLDVNLAPLAPGSPFNEAKSAIKWLEAALAETVTVASPTKPFEEVIDDGVNGYLARSPAEFAARVLSLLDDDVARARMARLARRQSLTRWSPHLQGRRYLDILENAELGRTRPAAWQHAEALDEPWIDVSVESYVIPDPMVLAPIDPPVDAVRPDGATHGADRGSVLMSALAGTARRAARRIRSR